MVALSSAVGAKTRRRPKLVSTDPNKVIALKAVRLLDIQEPHPLTSLNMVVCLNNKDLNQPGRWLTSSLQASSLVPNKVVMVVHQLSPQVNMPSLKCNMEVLPALVDTAVVSQPQIPNGVLPLLRATATALVATRDNVARSTPVYELSGFV